MENRTLITKSAVVVVSDLHVGDPENYRLEDFDRDADFSRLVTEIIPRRAGPSTTLVLGGDFIDFPQVLPELAKHSLGERVGVTEEQSMDKMKRVLKGHPAVFSGLGRYIGAGGQVIVLPGNHDIDLHWPSVWEELRKAVGSPSAEDFRFVSEGAIDERQLYIEHGNQYSYDNWFEHWGNPIIEANGEQRIERPWGTFFMDSVYNDLEELYPFVNKVYPHSSFAWVALRSLRDEENVSISALARLVVFFFTHGKRMAAGRLLGEQDAEPLQDSVSRFIESIDEHVDPNRVAALAAETMALLKLQPGASTEPSSNSESSEGPLSGLLGQNDERGLEKRVLELLQSGEVTVVSFGHTHHPIDGNMLPPWGSNDPRRAFNTGSWMPAIPIGAQEKPRWSELKARKATHDVRYLLVRLEDTPRAALEPILEG